MRNSDWSFTDNVEDQSIDIISFPGLFMDGLGKQGRGTRFCPYSRSGTRPMAPAAHVAGSALAFELIEANDHRSRELLSAPAANS